VKDKNEYWGHFLDRHPENIKEMDEAQSLVKNFYKNEESLSKDEIVEIWNNVKKSRVKQRKSIVLMKRILAVACVLLVLFASGWYLTQILPLPSQEINYQAIVTPEEALGGEVKLVLSDNTEKTLSSQDTKEVEIKYNLKGDAETTEGKISQEKKHPGVEVQMHQLIVPFGKRSNILLSDGTKLWLNSGSRAVYPVVFNKNYREIYVEGEAYLEVAKNKEKPFYVVTDKMKLRVLGTSFNINSYKEDKFSSVVLVEGSLMVTSGSDQTLMKPNQIVTYNNESGIKDIHEGNVEKYISWREGWLLCNKDPMGIVMNKISRYYGIKVELQDESIYSMTLSGKLDLKTKCEDVLNVICQTAPLKFETINNVVKVSKTKLVNGEG